MAMRLGAVKYIIPFCFAVNPALVAQGSLGEVLRALALAVVGVFVMGSGFEGWMAFVERRLGTIARIVAIGAGLCLLLPQTTTQIAGLVLTAALAAFLTSRPPSVPREDAGSESHDVRARAVLA